MDGCTGKMANFFCGFLPFTGHTFIKLTVWVAGKDRTEVDLSKFVYGLN
jgi:hypothetical protein